MIHYPPPPKKRGKKRKKKQLQQICSSCFITIEYCMNHSLLHGWHVAVLHLRLVLNPDIVLLRFEGLLPVHMKVIQVKHLLYLHRMQHRRPFLSLRGHFDDIISYGCSHWASWCHLWSHHSHARITFWFTEIIL